MTNVYYKKNVNYFVSVRMNRRDPIGRMLTFDNPDVAVPEDQLREFKLANKQAILEGTIIPTGEPSIDWETPNAIEDAELDDLLKSFLKLKSRLETITSMATLYKMLNTAKEQNKSPKVINLIQARIDVLEPVVDDPNEREGVV